MHSWEEFMNLFGAGLAGSVVRPDGVAGSPAWAWNSAPLMNGQTFYKKGCHMD